MKKRLISLVVAIAMFLVVLVGTIQAALVVQSTEGWTIIVYPADLDGDGDYVIVLPNTEVNVLVRGEVEFDEGYNETISGNRSITIDWRITKFHGETICSGTMEKTVAELAPSFTVISRTVTMPEETGQYNVYVTCEGREFQAGVITVFEPEPTPTPVPDVEWELVIHPAKWCEQKNWTEHIGDITIAPGTKFTVRVEGELKIGENYDPDISGKKRLQIRIKIVGERTGEVLYDGGYNKGVGGIIRDYQSSRTGRIIFPILSLPAIYTTREDQYTIRVTYEDESFIVGTMNVVGPTTSPTPIPTPTPSPTPPIPTPEAPDVTAFAPFSPVNDSEGATRTFNITTDQRANVSWLLNETVVQIAENVTEASYTNISATVGIWNITAVATNENGTIKQTWIWTVSRAISTPSPTPSPSLIATLTPTPTPTPTLTPMLSPTPSQIPSPEEGKPEADYPVPGFEAAFAIAGLLAVAYLLRRRK